MSWRCELSAATVAVTVRGSDESSPAGQADSPAVTVQGEPEAVFLWLWGRAGDDRVDLQGEPATVAELKARLVEAAQ
jgi:hypothetical protein